MRLYKWYGGKVETVNAVETKETYKIENSSTAFDWRSRIYKDSLPKNGIGITKKEALKLALMAAQRKESNALFALQQARFDMGKIKDALNN